MHIGQITDQVGGVSGRMADISDILGQQQGASSEIAHSISGVADSASQSEKMVGEIARIMHIQISQFAQNAREAFDETSNAALCYMTKIDHVLFKQRVIDTCMGNDNWHSKDVPDHHRCRLGKWYDTLDNPEISTLPAYQKLKDPHQRVHRAAHDALDAHEVGNHAAMVAGLDALDKASVEVIESLDELSQAIIDIEDKKPALRRA